MASTDSIQYQLQHYNDDKGPAVIAGSVILISIATTVVVLRLVARRIAGTTWRADDYSIIASLVFAYGMFVTLIACTHYGMGKHAVRVGLTNVKAYLKSLYSLEAIYPACTATTKISILLLYRRIFTTNDARFRWALYVVGALLIAWGISGFFTTVFQCTPVHYLWDRDVITGHCVAMQPSLLGLAAINTILNFAVLVLPIPMIWQLQMRTRQKVAVAGILVLGSLDILSSIIRTYMMSKVTLSIQDITWIDADGVFLAFVEPCVGIICACLPAIRPLFRGFHAPTFSRPYKNSQDSYSSSDETGRSNGNGTRHSRRSGRSGVMSFGDKAHRDWAPLDPRADQSVVSEIQRGSVSREQSLGEDDGVPMQGIKVKSDLEWSVLPKA